jgi:hypothetical protein
VLSAYNFEQDGIVVTKSLKKAKRLEKTVTLKRK